MSVINKMLKDLDNRQQSHGVKNISTMPQSEAYRNNKLPWFIVILLLAAGGSYYLYQSQQSEPAGTKSSQIDSSKQLKDKVIDIETAQAATLPTKSKPNQTPIAATSKLAATTSNTASVKLSDRFPNNKKIQQQKEQREILEQDKTNGFDGSSNEDKKDALPQAAIKKQNKRNAVEKPQTAKSVLEITEVKLTSKQLSKKLSHQALVAEQNGDLALARKSYAKALQLNLNEHSVRSKLAALYYGERNIKGATQLLNDGIKRFPQQSEFKLLLAKIQAKERQPQKALSTLGTIDDSSQLAAEKWIQQGTIAQQQKQYKQAIEAFQKLINHEPLQARWWLGLGYNLDASGQYLRAEKTYRTALKQSNLSSASRKYIVSRLAQINASK